MKTKKNSKILEAVYETATDLHSCGLLDDEKMKQYNALCLEPVTLYLEPDIVEYLNKKCDFNRNYSAPCFNDCPQLRKKPQRGKMFAA